MHTRLIMFGASGRMGRRILALAAADPAAFTIEAGVDVTAGSLRDLGLDSDAPLHDRLPVVPGAAVIDFSTAAATPAVIAHCAEHGMPLAIGTTGIEPAVLDGALTDAANRIPILAAPNMSLGVNLVLAVAARMAAALGLDYDVEVVEAHHNRKLDAPSGTAWALADAIATATGRTRGHMACGREGHTGERPRGEIGVHALRMGDVVGDHTAWFVGNQERIAISHQAHSRDIFARGALRAAAFLATAEPGRYTMPDVLGLD